MAEAMVSVLLEQLASITRKQIEEEVSLVVNVEQEVENLIFHLNAVKAVLQDAEERQVHEAKNWLHNLEDVSYDINDVLDEWNTEILKHQVEKQEKEALTKRKVCFFIPPPSVCFGKIGQVIMRHDIAIKINEITEKLTSIATLRQNYYFQNTTRGNEQLERFKTSSFVNVSTIIGREEEKKNLMSLLLSESSQGGRSQLVIPIVGKGGLGKTAFAQLVYNDENVKNHFDERIWVCVSVPFEEIKVAKAIIEVLNKDDSRMNSTEFDTLLKCMFESISRKKVLLVLDDVWNPTDNKWEPLKEVFRNSDIGSRILVTTRNKMVAIGMGAVTDHVINLNKLSDLDCLLLFCRIAFFDRERDESRFLDEDFKERIARKCDGLPLATKTLASLMRYKKTRRQWIDVLDIRRCLLYCATFPKDYEFYKNKLIELWISQDYINVKGDAKKVTILGESYFDNLVMRSFFQDFVTDELENIIGCKMHDIVHDFVQFLTKKECVIIDAKIAKETKKVCHLNIMSPSNDAVPILISQYCRRLRTLIATNSGLSTISSDSILQLKCLRTLDLSNNSIEKLPEEMELPDTLGYLCNLQTLRLAFCTKLEKLPATKLSKEIGRLTGLKTLSELRLYDDGIGYNNNNKKSNSKGFFQLGDLRNLDQLQGTLWITNLKLVKDASEAKMARLANKKNLVRLDMHFGRSDREEGEQREMDEEILNAFEPHPNLERLLVFGYQGNTLFLKWMLSLHNLRWLEVVRLPFCKFLAPLGKLPCLEYFKMDGMKSLKKVGVEFLGLNETTQQTKTILSFPKLKTLVFKGMGEWEEWEGVEGWREDDDSEITIMPSLSHLWIMRCPQLKTLPDFLWKTPLHNLTVSSCSLLQGWEEGRRRESDQVSHIPNIKIDDQFVRKDGVWMDQPDTTENP
ncbi:LOW QUALITY PROTEIN: hypothetical protein PRUPE_1G538500 [Prunus persica]|uniref:NB-ARC domain-containing protein n=2 Tax=Prunus persica TaxID=3760 RepID=A0A251RHI6_PRUPE|nr:LOW QUALITY PROTEIN: hypothetical protein PRUPE_1G538500 [Prunus persica]